MLSLQEKKLTFLISRTYSLCSDREFAVQFLFKFMYRTSRSDIFQSALKPLTLCHPLSVAQKGNSQTHSDAYAQKLVDSATKIAFYLDQTFSSSENIFIMIFVGVFARPLPHFISTESFAQICFDNKSFLYASNAECVCLGSLQLP